MGNLNPLLRDTADFTHKLWDHLFIMSDFQLDVDSPYPQPTRQELTITPRRMAYSQGRISFKHYGKYVERMIGSLAGDKDRRLSLIHIWTSRSNPRPRTATRRTPASSPVISAPTIR